MYKMEGGTGNKILDTDAEPNYSVIGGGRLNLIKNQAYQEPLL